MDEQSFVAGNRSAWSATLQKCLMHLGYDSEEGAAHSWILEREAAIAVLRDVCADYGDNDWEDDLHLADVIEKHLSRHLYEG
jgi:hypothetical protein